MIIVKGCGGNELFRISRPHKTIEAMKKGTEEFDYSGKNTKDNQALAHLINTIMKKTGLGNGDLSAEMIAIALREKEEQGTHMILTLPSLCPKD